MPGNRPSDPHDRFNMQLRGFRPNSHGPALFLFVSITEQLGLRPSPIMDQERTQSGKPLAKSNHDPTQKT